MITAEQAKKLASEKFSGHLDWVLDQIEIEAKKGELSFDLPNEIKITRGDICKLEELGFKTSIWGRELTIHWA